MSDSDVVRRARLMADTTVDRLEGVMTRENVREALFGMFIMGAATSTPADVARAVEVMVGGAVGELLEPAAEGD